MEGHGTSGLVDAIPDESLAQAYAIDSTVVVARVTGVLRPLAADDPQLSVYSAEVTDAVTGELHTGDTFALWQNGGLLDGIVYEQQEDPMVRLGCSYLFMLEPFYGFAEIDLPEPWGQPWAFPMSGRFNITEDGRLAPTADYWSAGHPATDLVGLMLDEAKARFRAVAAQVTPVPRPTPAAVISQ